MISTTDAGRPAEPGAPLPWLRQARSVALLDGALREPLRPPIPGEPKGLRSLVAAGHAAQRVLRGLERIHDVSLEGAGRRAFEGVVLRGALAPWRQGTVGTCPGGLEVASAVCPLAAMVAGDPGLCHRCQLVQEILARRIMPGKVQAVSVSTRAGPGDPACVLRIVLADPPGQAAEPGGTG